MRKTLIFIGGAAFASAWWSYAMFRTHELLLAAGYATVFTVAAAIWAAMEEPY